jgi:hypothetical protein
MLGSLPVQGSTVKCDDESASPKHDQEQDVDDFDALMITVTAKSGSALASLVVRTQVVRLRYLAGTCVVTRSW